MARRNDKTRSINISYLIIVSLFLIIVYCLTNYCFSRFFTKDDLLISAGAIATTNSPVSANKQTNAQATNQSSLIFQSFFDSFASAHLIDITQTNLYRDDAAAAVIFPPEYSWQAAGDELVAKNANSFKDVAVNDFSRPLEMADRRCLGNECLELSGKKLTFQGKILNLPRDIKASEVTSISIGALSKRWLIGLTLKEGANYEGYVYYFDGKKFTPLLLASDSKFISSPYRGVFGFGGEESDFLVIYGAYRGLGYRVQEKKITDISSFFDYRIMAQGFRPEIIKANNESTVNWYIFSSSLGHPQLLKLWQNSRGEISGEVAYQEIFTSSGETVLFRLLSAEANEFKLLARVQTGGAEAWQVFSDRGFSNSMLGELVFNPIKIDTQIIIKELASAKLGTDSLPCAEGKFLFSADNKNWRELARSQNSNPDFFGTLNSNYYLRVNFPAQPDKFYSPFLAEVLFDFYYQK